MAGHDEFHVARTSDGTYFRVTGFGNLQNAPIFNSFAEKMIEEGYYHFVIDLERCRGLDSTFMGTLLGVNNNAREANEAGEGGVVLINVPSQCRKQLSSIGLDTFLVFHDTPEQPPKGELRLLETRSVSAQERLDLILKAHRDLVAADQRNEAKFGPFLRSILENR